jgi:hypothetical protein
LFSGCLESPFFLKQIKKEEARRYKTKGTMVFGSINVENYRDVQGIMLMFKNASDASIIAQKEKTYFLLDVPEKCEGLARIGIRLRSAGADEWINGPFSFTLESNKINYIGQIVLLQATMLHADRIYFTNLLDEDKEAFLDEYEDLTNYEFVPTSISNKVFDLY